MSMLLHRPAVSCRPDRAGLRQPQAAAARRYALARQPGSDQRKPQRRAWQQRASLLARVADPSQLAITLLFVTFLAGGFSLHRLDPELRRFGELAYVRTWLVLALIGLLLRRRRGRWAVPKFSTAAPFVHAVAVSQIYIALTTLWSLDAEGTFPRVFGQLMLALLLELALVAVRRAPRQAARWVLDWSLAAALLYAVGGLTGGSERGRMAMFFGGPNVFVRVVGSGVLASVYRALATRRLAWLAPAPLLLVCAVESGSRGGMLALLFTLPVLAWAVATSGVLRRRPVWWLAAPVAGALALAVAGAYVLSQANIRRYVEERYLVYAPSSYDPAEVDFGSRDRLFAAALETFLEHPALGSGLSPIGDFEQLDAHPHNLFLATARDGGVVGLMLLSIPFAMLVARLRRPLALEHRMAFVLGCFYLCAAQFSGTYYDCRFLWLYFLIVMLPAASPRLAQQQRPR
jgi:O-Antigen ligase